MAGVSVDPAMVDVNSLDVVEAQSFRDTVTCFVVWCTGLFQILKKIILEFLSIHKGYVIVVVVNKGGICVQMAYRHNVISIIHTE